MNLKKVHPELVKRILWVQNYAKFYGVDSRVTSGFRTYAEQKRLYEHPEGFPVSPPGCTSHELGLAIDLVASGSKALPSWGEKQKFLMDLANYVGLTTYQSDPIHFTLFNLSQLSQIKAQVCR